jgi:hypothetical protein
MVLTAYFVLSPVIGLSCHRRLRRCFRKLDAGVEASGPRDFAVRGKHRSSATLRASTASRPASVTIASRPSVWDGMIWLYSCFYPAVKRNSEIPKLIGDPFPLDVPGSGVEPGQSTSPLRNSRHIPRKWGIKYAAAFRLYR